MVINLKEIKNQFHNPGSWRFFLIGDAAWEALWLSRATALQCGQSVYCIPEQLKTQGGKKCWPQARTAIHQQITSALNQQGVCTKKR